MQGSYTGFKNWKLALGVKNLFDRDPPKSNQQQHVHPRLRSVVLRSARTLPVYDGVVHVQVIETVLLSKPFFISGAQNATRRMLKSGSVGDAMISTIATMLLVAATALTSTAALAQGRCQRRDRPAGDAPGGEERQARAYVESAMNLDAAEAKRFWPIYDAYQQTLDAGLRRRVVAMPGFMFRDAPVTNLAAKQYATEMLAIDEAEVRGAADDAQSRDARAARPSRPRATCSSRRRSRAVQDYDAAASVPLRAIAMVVTLQRSEGWGTTLADQLARL